MHENEIQAAAVPKFSDPNALVTVPCVRAQRSRVSVCAVRN